MLEALVAKVNVLDKIQLCRKKMKRFYVPK